MKLLPTLKQLEYFTALAETHHFGQASARCNVAVSTLSAGIQELESVLGVTLAERTKRKVMISPVGEEIACRAREVLSAAEDIMALATRSREPLTGELRLGVIPTVGPFLLPRVLIGLRHRFPALRLLLEEGLTQAMLDHLRGGDLDGALVALPFETGDLAVQVLFQDAFVFACHRSHPYAQKSRITAEELASESLMLLEEGHCLRTHALEACRLHATTQRSRFEASSFHTLVQMVGAGIGVTLLPQLAVDARIAEAMDIALVPLAEPAYRDIALLWRKASPRAAEYRLLGVAMQALIAEAPAHRDMP